MSWDIHFLLRHFSLSFPFWPPTNFFFITLRATLPATNIFDVLFYQQEKGVQDCLSSTSAPFSYGFPPFFRFNDYFIRLFRHPYTIIYRRFLRILILRLNIPPVWIHSDFSWHDMKTVLIFIFAPWFYFHLSLFSLTPFFYYPNLAADLKILR